MNDAGGVKSAERTLALLEYVAERGAVTFTQVLNDLALPRSSTFGLVNTLVAAGWLRHERDTRQYRLGLRAWQVGQRYAGHHDVASLASPIMDRLRDTVGETVQLAQLDGIENVYVAISQSPEPMRLASSVGMRLHAHATGIGKALLSMLEPDEARRRLDGASLPQLTEHTVTSSGGLLTLIDEVRRRGYALDDEEYVSGCRCVAVPLLTTPDGDPFAMSVTMPTSRTAQDWPAGLLTPLEAAAQEIRTLLSPSPR